MCLTLSVTRCGCLFLSPQKDEPVASNATFICQTARPERPFTVCVRERESVCERESVRVCVREREGECV